MIIILTQCFPSRIGGIESLVSNLALGLSKKEKIIVFADQNSLSKDDIYDRKHKDQLLVKRTGGIKFFRKRKKIRNLKSFLLTNKIKCVIGDSWKSFELCIDVINSNNIPSICLAHGNELIIKNNRHSKRIEDTLNQVTFIIANSDFTYKLINEFNLDKPIIKKIYPGAVDYNSIKEEFVPNISGDPILFTLARLEKRKGHKEIINSIMYLKSEFPNIQYIIAGSGYELENLKKLVKKLDIIKNILFVGNINDSQKKFIFDKATLMVMPTIDERNNRSIEGFGISYLEAAFFGIPSIASEVGGTPEAVIHNNTGIIIKDISELYKAIRELLLNKVNLEKFGLNAKKRATENFSWNIITGQYVNLINSLTKFNKN